MIQGAEPILFNHFDSICRRDPVIAHVKLIAMIRDAAFRLAVPTENTIFSSVGSSDLGNGLMASDN